VEYYYIIITPLPRANKQKRVGNVNLIVRKQLMNMNKNADKREENSSAMVCVYQNIRIIATFALMTQAKNVQAQNNVKVYAT